MSILIGGLFWSIEGLDRKTYLFIADSFHDHSKRYGYQLHDIVITGRKHTSPQAILQLVGTSRGDGIFKYGVRGIQERLSKGLPWIKHANVRRILPGQLLIDISERTPIALWQHQKKFYLLDDEGIVIEDSVEGFESLPVIVGHDAPRSAPKLLHLLNQYPEVKKRLTALVSIQMRRFDLILQGNLTIKLPEIHTEAALARLNFLLETKKINLDEVTMIDLRLPKQLIAKVPPQTAARLKLKLEHFT